MNYELRIMNYISVSQSFALAKICLCYAEAKEEVEADGYVVRVVGDIESDDFLFLAIRILYKREDYAFVSNAGALHLEVFAATIDERDVLNLVPVGHRHPQLLAFLHIVHIEGTRPHQQAHHIIEALRAVVGLLCHFAGSVAIALAKMRLATGIAVPHLIHIIATALVCSFLVVSRSHVLGDDALHRVSHHEEAVQARTGSSDEMSLVGRLAFPFRG